MTTLTTTTNNSILFPQAPFAEFSVVILFGIDIANKEHKLSISSLIYVTLRF